MIASDFRLTPSLAGNPCVLPAYLPGTASRTSSWQYFFMLLQVVNDLGNGWEMGRR